MRHRIHLPEKISNLIQKKFENFSGHSNQGTPTPSDIGNAILWMSDFYIENPQKPTPWKEKWVQLSQLAYYFPLNYLRSKQIMSIASYHHFFKGVDKVIEFGSGIAPTTKAILDSHCINSPLVYWIEKSEIATQYAKDFCEGNQVKILTNELPKDFKKTVGIFSYSLTEIENLPSWTLECSHLIFIEPSTSEDGRKLLQLRNYLIQNDFEIIAPCTHQGLCPLLTQSQKDWCHDRIEISMPDWFLKIENLLPIKNSNITYSYLLARKKDNSLNQQAALARVVGDLLPDKGKSRVLICRSENREFLSRLDRHESLPQIDRGDLLEIVGGIKKGNNELRSDSNQDFKVIFKPTPLN